MLMEMAQQQGSQLTSEFFTNNSLNQVLDDSQIQVPNAFPGDWCEVQGWGGTSNNSNMNNQWDDCDYGMPMGPNNNYSNQVNDPTNQVPSRITKISWKGNGVCKTILGISGQILVIRKKLKKNL